MGADATLSILGLYTLDNSIFDLMQFPTEFTIEQKQTTINSILYELCNVEVLYANPTVMKNLIGIWSAKELPVWQRIHTAALIEYDPLENYNRTEKETFQDDHSDTHSGTDTTTGNSNSTDTNSGTDTNTGYVAAYDSAPATPVKRSVDEFEHGHVLTNYSASGSSIVHGEKIVHDGDTERNTHAFGNIGITSNQQMLTQEVEVAKIINVMSIIVESFKDRFCVLVY